MPTRRAQDRAATAVTSCFEPVAPAPGLLIVAFIALIAVFLLVQAVPSLPC